jgi:sodium/hydrogen antiporter
VQAAIWSVVIGLLLIFLALSGTVLSRLPLSTAMLYLGVGALVSPWGLDLVRFEIAQHTLLLERLTEVVVLVSLFTAGLKLSPGLKDRSWVLPLRLALVSMVVTVSAIAAIAYSSWGCRRAHASCWAAFSRPPIRCSHPMCKSIIRATATGCVLP